jgi:hypothetical protein
MTLPDLTQMDISKKMLMALTGAYFVKDIIEFRTAVLVSGLIAVGIICQTVIDIFNLKKPTLYPAEPRA